MKSKLSGAVALLAVLLSAALPVMAHHGLNTEFQMGKPTAITGVLTRVDWENPHIYWEVDVKEADGTVSHWNVEGLPPSYLHRSKVERQDMVALIGTQVTVHGRLAKDGSKLMFGLDFTLPDGRVIPVGPRAGDANAQ
jgi:Family of unknown function (DUF6152)